MNFKKNVKNYEERDATISFDEGEQFSQLLIQSNSSDAWKESGFFVGIHRYLKNVYKFSYSVSRFTGSDEEKPDENPTITISDDGNREITFSFDWDECDGSAAAMLAAVYNCPVIEGQFVFQPLYKGEVGPKTIVPM